MDWSELTPHEEVGRFYQALARRSPEVGIVEIGKSREGRDLLLVTLSRPTVFDAFEGRASGKPIILVVAQVHGDEPAGKEALMLFARDVATGDLAHLLDSVIFVLVPQLNPDGAASGAWGRRTTADGHDLNRDYLRLEHPETLSVVERAIVEWRPHVVVDAHELRAPPPVFDFYTLAPDNINGLGAPARFARDRVIPLVVRLIEAAGFSHSEYPTVTGGPALGFSSDADGARALTSYAGAHGAISILFETPRPEDARIGLERRTRIQHLALEALGRIVASESAEIVTAVEEGRAAERGARMNGRDSITLRHGPLADTGVSLSRVRPLGYAIAPHRSDLAHHLVRHGFRVERTRERHVLEVEGFRVGTIGGGPNPSDDSGAQRVSASTTRELLALAAGSFVIRTDQPGSVLLFHLLEPEDENSFASAGAFDEDAGPGRTLPVYRLLELPPRDVLEPFP